jgi:hypothetical protein
MMNKAYDPISVPPSRTETVEPITTQATCLTEALHGLNCGLAEIRSRLFGEGESEAGPQKGSGDPVQTVPVTVSVDCARSLTKRAHEQVDSILSRL